MRNKLWKLELVDTVVDSSLPAFTSDEVGAVGGGGGGGGGGEVRQDGEKDEEDTYPHFQPHYASSTRRKSQTET